MKTKSYLRLTCVILALAFTSCFADLDPKPDNYFTGTIYYSVSQAGGYPETVMPGGTLREPIDTTGIYFSFSAPVDSLNLSAADITVGGAASIGAAELTGEGQYWTLSPITVNAAGTATVQITKTGIEAATKNITVYKKAAPVLTGITAAYSGAGTIYTFTLLDSLKDHLTVTAAYNKGSNRKLEQGEYALSGNLTVGNSVITVSYTEGGVTKTATFPVTVSNAELAGITVSYNPGGVVIYTSTPLNSLKQYLTVTATYDDGSGGPLTEHEYTLSCGSDNVLTAGTPAVTVNYGGKTETFNPTVTAVALAGITAQFNQNGAVIYTSTPLDDLKQYLIVTAVNNDGSENTLNTEDYSLSGSLTAGTPAVTVNYGGKTGTFTPTVTAVVLTGITAQYTGSATVEINTNINTIKNDLVVTAAYNDGSEKILNAANYSLSGALTAVASGVPITVIYTEGGVTETATFTVTVICANHSYQWVQTTAAAVATNGAETEKCGICDVTGATRVLWATGAAGLAFEGIPNDTNPTAYRVRKGTVTGGAVYIPAYHRATTNYEDYRPVTEIGSASDNMSNGGAFYDTGITAVTIPAGITSIGQSAFYQCGNLTNITIPPGVTFIGERAFANCNSLTGITIPAGVTAAGSNAFFNWTASQTINIAGYCGQAAADAAWWETGTSGWRYYCNAIIQYTGPHDWNTGPTTIPATETKNGMVAITCTYDSTHTKDEDFNGEYATGTAGLDYEGLYNYNPNTGMPMGPPYAFRVKKGAVTGGAVHIPAYHRLNADSAYLPVREIGSAPGVSYAFAGANITAVTFAAENQLTVIGNGAFSGCNSLTNITIPASVVSIDTYAFGQCANLASVTFAAGSQLQTIGYRAFYGCSSLTGITIPASVTSIGYSSENNDYGVFEGCANLASVTFAVGSQLQTIGENAFRNCASLTGITIPAGVTSIGDVYNGGYNSNIGIFYGCTSLTSVTFAAGSQLQTIGDRTFYSCTGLTSITIPASVTSIGYQAFYNCTGLTNITLPAGLTSIGASAFRNWMNNQTINIAEYCREEAANGAWSTNWRDYCYAYIQYRPHDLHVIINSATDTNNGSEVTTCNIGGETANTKILYATGTAGLAYELITSGTNANTYRVTKGTVTTGAVHIPAYRLNANGVYLPVTEIGGASDNTMNGAFYNTGITAVTFAAESQLKIISRYAFRNCSLTSIAIPESVTEIGVSAFERCNSIHDITIPASVTAVGYGAFSFWANGQTINVQGYPNESAANIAWNTTNTANWRFNCNAVVKYWNGSSYQ